MGQQCRFQCSDLVAAYTLSVASVVQVCLLVVGMFGSCFFDKNACCQFGGHG